MATGYMVFGFIVGFLCGVYITRKRLCNQHVAGVALLAYMKEHQ